MMQCLTDVFGVTTSDCECIIQGLSTEQRNEFAVSKSGLYMDDLEGGIHLKALNNVDACRKMYDIAKTAKNNAVKRLQDDLTVAVNGRYKKDKANFAGQIGRMSYAQSLNVSKKFIGLRIQPKDYADGVLTISRIMIILNAAVNVNIKVFRAPYGTVIGEEIYSFNVDTVANAYATVATLTTPLVLPFIADNGEPLDYYFLYDITEPGTPVLPKDNGIQCATCGTPWHQFANITGIELDDTNALNLNIQRPYAYGLVLDAEIKCDNERLFCREYSAQDAVAICMAYAAWYKSGELLIEDVIKQTDVTRYTTMSKEYLWGKRTHFRKEYESRLQYLASIIDVSASNCYVCRQTTNQPFFSGILS